MHISNLYLPQSSDDPEWKNPIDLGKNLKIKMADDSHLVKISCTTLLFDIILLPDKIINDHYNNLLILYVTSTVDLEMNSRSTISQNTKTESGWHHNVMWKTHKACSWLNERSFILACCFIR